MLKIRNLESGYGKLKVIKGISMHVARGEIVAIIGANGAGKTTLMHSIANIVKPFSGTIVFAGNDITSMKTERLAYAGCVLVPEGRLLFPDMSVKENLLMGAYPLIRKQGRNHIRNLMEEVFVLFPRLREREHQLAGTLSGGEQQMVAIGRALMSQPQFIMMDEPSMGLAPLVVREIFGLIKKLRDGGRTVLLIEQNARAALGIADRGYVLETGSLFLEGTAQELLENKDVQRAYLGKEYKHIND